MYTASTATDVYKHRETDPDCKFKVIYRNTLRNGYQAGVAHWLPPLPVMQRDVRSMFTVYDEMLSRVTCKWQLALTLGSAPG